MARTSTTRKTTPATTPAQVEPEHYPEGTTLAELAYDYRLALHALSRHREKAKALARAITAAMVERRGNRFAVVPDPLCPGGAIVLERTADREYVRLHDEVPVIKRPVGPAALAELDALERSPASRP